MYKSEQRRKAIGNCTLTSSKKTSIMSLLKRTYLCGKSIKSRSWLSIDSNNEGCSTIRPNTFRPITLRPMSFCPKTICPTIFSPHDFCPYTILSCMIYVQKYFVHNVLGHKYLVQNRFSPKAFCLNTFSPCPLLSTQF